MGLGCWENYLGRAEEADFVAVAIAVAIAVVHAKLLYQQTH
jgi:hypothetical protein